MKKSRFTIAALATAMAALGAPAHAAEWKFSGFGTIGGAKSNTDAVAFNNDPYVSGGARKSFEFIDNKIAVQADAIIDDKLSFTAQVMSKRWYDNSYRPKVEWAYAKYKITPDLYVRAGRFYPSSFMLTDFANVGYANILVRPPVGVYGPRAQPGPADGADITWKLNAGDYIYTLNGGFADNELNSYNGSVTTSKFGFANAAIERGNWSGRVGYTKGSANGTSTALAPLFDGIALLGALSPTGYPLAAGYARDLANAQNHFDFSFASLGMIYDDGTWQLQSEVTQLRVYSPLATSANDTAWFVTGARRFGNLTPYVSYMRNTKDGSSEPIAPAWMTGFFAPQLAAGLNAATASNHSSKSVSLGLRWDFMKNMAAKFQYDRITVDNGGNGFFYAGNTGQYPGGFNGRANVISAALDFVF